MSESSSPFVCDCPDCATWRRVRGVQQMTEKELRETREIDLERQLDLGPKPETPA